MPNYSQDQILVGLAENKPLFDAVKNALLDEFRATTDEGGFDDMRLGQMYRARIVGVQSIETVFKNIERLKKGQPGQPREAKHR